MLVKADPLIAQLIDHLPDANRELAHTETDAISLAVMAANGDFAANSDSPGNGFDFNEPAGDFRYLYTRTVRAPGNALASVLEQLLGKELLTVFQEELHVHGETPDQEALTATKSPGLVAGRVVRSSFDSPVAEGTGHVNVETHPQRKAPDPAQWVGIGRSDGAFPLLVWPMSDFTRMLSAIEQGDPQAAAQLLPLVYDELRRLAAQRLAQEKHGQTLQATALVHEAYLRLVDNEAPQQWNSRGHFFAAAAEAMRRILVEQARRRNAAKRGGQANREELEESAIAASEPAVDVLALHEALEHLEKVDAAAADLVKLRFFAGLTMGEAAEALAMSVRSAHDLWAYARSWLRREIGAG
jgi:RNA polymerase sigma factor (TIGR02999 family)